MFKKEITALFSLFGGIGLVVFAAWISSYGIFSDDPVAVITTEVSILTEQQNCIDEGGKFDLYLYEPYAGGWLGGTMVLNTETNEWETYDSGVEKLDFKKKLTIKCDKTVYNVEEQEILIK